MANLGVKLVIYDFGTGYSSLSGLATVGWTDGDLVSEVHAKESKCQGQDRRTHRSSAERRSAFFAREEIGGR